METHVDQAPAAEAEHTFSLMERVRNSHLGRKALALAASLTLLGGAGEQALNPNSVNAESTPAQNSTSPATYTEQDIDLALAQPAVVNPLRMRQAGIRPYTGWHWSQAVVGAVQYPEIENPNLIRNASGRLQDFRKGAWRFLYGGSPGGWQGNFGGASDVFSRPSHADPGYRYLFNDCVPGKGFHPVRLILDLVVKDAETKDVIGDKEYIYPVPVQGNCAAARRSSRIAEKQMEKNYGI